MAFTDLNFLSRFLPIVLIIYFLAPRKYRTSVLFGASLVFYAFGDLRFLPLLIILCTLNYGAAVLYFKLNENTGLLKVNKDLGLSETNEASGLLKNINKKRSRKFILTAIVLIDIAALLIFKILLINYKLPLPLGISFYIFKMLSFQADLYRGKIGRKPKFVVLAAYFSLFFQLPQGPIMRYRMEDFAGSRQKLSLANIEDGLKILIIGLSMKVLVADKLAILWNEASKIGYDGLSTPLAWLAAVGYSLELYLDFWGYSLMAAGIGMMFGFRFIRNFNHPYTADSIGEFYRRWHITLTSWFRDYVYIPLGGSRNGRINTVFAILMVWLLTGFWHGGTVNFLMWGLVLGAMIAWEKYIAREWMNRFPILGHLHVIILIPITWVIFAVSDLSDLGDFLAAMIPIGGIRQGANPGDFARYFIQYLPYLGAGVLLCVPQVYRLLIKKRQGNYKIAEAIILVILLWASLYSVNTTAANPFMYFYF